MIGGDAALRCKAMGHDVTVAGRNAPDRPARRSAIAPLKGNYIENSFDKADLAKFDAVVFAAGNDVRHIPEDGGDDYWRGEQHRHSALLRSAEGRRREACREHRQLLSAGSATSRRGQRLYPLAQENRTRVSARSPMPISIR